MLFPSRLWPGISDGSVTVAFRRWKRPTVKQGGTLTSPAGLLGIDEVAVVDPAEITDVDARAAGSSDVAAVLGELRPDGVLHRIRFHRIGDDPRLELRERTDLEGEELDGLLAAVGRLEWAVPFLRLIDARPAVVSTELAAEVGMERAVFKQRVRRLKSLGLTESLEVGYRLSPRGVALLARLDEDSD